MSPRSLSSASRNRCQELAGSSPSPRVGIRPSERAPARSTSRAVSGSAHTPAVGGDGEFGGDRLTGHHLRRRLSRYCRDVPQTDGLDQIPRIPPALVWIPCVAPGICRDRPGHCAHRRLRASGTAGHDLGEEALRHNRSSRPDLDRPASRAELCDRLDQTRRERSRHPQAAATRWRSCPTDGVRRSLLVIDVCRVLNPTGAAGAPGREEKSRSACGGPACGGKPPRHPVMSWYRGAPVACAARERHVTRRAER